MLDTDYYTKLFKTTRRQGQNRSYAYYAATILFKHRHEHPEFLELTGCVEGELRGEWVAYPQPTRGMIGPLTELGRIARDFDDGEEAIVGLAVELLGMRPRPTSKQAVARFRNLRMLASRREPLKGTAEGITDAICKAVDAYLDAHPGTPAAALLEGIQDAAWYYRDGNSLR